MGKILLEHELEEGLVTAEDEQGPFTDGPHSQNKWVLLIGDGLSLQDFSNCLRTLISLKFSFTNDYYQQLKVFKQALDKFVPVPGDLHVSFNLFA